MQAGHNGSKQHSQVQKLVMNSLGWKAHLTFGTIHFLSVYRKDSFIMLWETECLLIIAQFYRLFYYYNVIKQAANTVKSFSNASSFARSQCQLRVQVCEDSVAIFGEKLIDINFFPVFAINVFC